MWASTGPDRRKPTQVRTGQRWSGLDEREQGHRAALRQPGGAESVEFGVGGVPDECRQLLGVGVDERLLAGRVRLDRRAAPPRQVRATLAPAGAAEAKVSDSAMAEKLSFVAGSGHPCGVPFHAKPHLKEHPEYAWQGSLLEDLKTNAWTVVAAQTAYRP